MVNNIPCYCLKTVVTLDDLYLCRKFFFKLFLRLLIKVFIFKNLIEFIT